MCVERGRKFYALESTRVMVRRGNARAHGCIIAIPRWERHRRARRRGLAIEEEERRGKERREKEEEEEEESMLASPGMPADHERCRYDEFTFYSLPTGRFTLAVPSTCPRYPSFLYLALLTLHVLFK